MVRWLLQVALLAAPALAGAFDYFEHRAVGRGAYIQAVSTELRNDPAMSALLQEAEGILGLSQAGEQHPLTSGSEYPIRALGFGDMTALAGDLAADAPGLAAILRRWRDAANSRDGTRDMPLLDMVRATSLQLDNACRWLYRMLAADAQPLQVRGEECFDDLVAGASTDPGVRPYARRGYQAGREERAAFEKLPRYVDLARDNRDHFPTFSWRRYMTHHRAALALARCARAGACGAAAGGAAALAQALLEEALAQHFLHDSFASGHMGTEFGNCMFWLVCSPPKFQVQHTHDVLNEIGLRVHFEGSNHYWQGSGARQEWTAFGDQHLFVPEAAFHRAVLFAAATASVREVLAAAATGRADCGMCSTATFPRPAENGRSASAAGTEPAQEQSLVTFVPMYGPKSQVLFGKRSPDRRVPDISVEGWKLSIADGSQRRRKSDRAIFSPDSAHGLMLRADYIRSTAEYWPNVYGIEFWNLPSRGTLWGISAGWMVPHRLTPAALVLRGRLGYRVDDHPPGAPAGERARSAEIAFPIVEVIYELYRPLALFAQFELLTYDKLHSREIGYGRKDSRFAMGLRWDFSDIK